VCPWREKPGVLTSVRCAFSDLDTVLTLVDFAQQSRANSTWYWLAVITVQKFQLKDETSSLGIHPDQALSFDIKGDVVVAILLVHLDWS